MLLNQRSQVENLSKKLGGIVGTSSNIRKIEIVKTPKTVENPVKPAAPITPAPKTAQPQKRGCNCSRRKK